MSSSVLLLRSSASNTRLRSAPGATVVSSDVLLLAATGSAVIADTVGVGIEDVEMIGGDSATHGELLSLLFFDSAFTSKLIEMGRGDARSWLSEMHDAGEGPWQIGPLANFVMPRQWTAG